MLITAVCVSMCVQVFAQTGPPIKEAIRYTQTFIKNNTTIILVRLEMPI